MDLSNNQRKPKNNSLNFDMLDTESEENKEFLNEPPHETNHTKRKHEISCDKRESLQTNDSQS